MIRFKILLFPSKTSIFRTGCNPSSEGTGTILLVARGECTFEEKLLSALASNADGLIVFNSLQGIYQNRLYASSLDYDCGNGVGYIQNISLPVYDIEMPSECTSNSMCASQKCVIANETADDGTSLRS